MKKRYLVWILLMVFLLGLSFFRRSNINYNVTAKKIDILANGTWQGEIKFPNWRGYVDDSLALNSMYSFDGYKDQGEIYITIDKKVKDYDLFINNKKINTKDMKNGIYELDISRVAINGSNTIQVTNIEPSNLKEAISVNVPYPKIIKGKLEDVGINKESLNVIDKIIQSDIDNGFTSAEMAIIKDGKLVYENEWGRLNSYKQDGKRLTSGKYVTEDTLYDLASNTKMYSVAYAIEYLLDNEKISLDDKVVDLLGSKFVDDTLEIKFASFEGKYPGLNTIKKWKSEITIKNLMMHQAGFPDNGHYHLDKFDMVNQRLDDKVKNVLYVENANREKTLKYGINKTPLMYKPGSKTAYSDIDYMLLGLIIEKITNKDLNTFLKETYWKPMGLKNITYNPLENGFKENSCAATELNGNTRDGIIDFPRIRKNTIRCEVHDEEAYYMMDGISGHAGLFANAIDLAKLASVMLTGGYGNNRFFSKNTRDLFIAPQSSSTINYGIGWWREADDKRAWYFGTQSPESTIGHQGWTGTLTMIDFENNMVLVFLTNSKNTPIVGDKVLDNANNFAGNYYVTNSLGFVSQILYTGINQNINPKDSLKSLVKDMINEKQKAIDEYEEETKNKVDDKHPIKKAKKALEDVLKGL